MASDCQLLNSASQYGFGNYGAPACNPHVGKAQLVQVSPETLSCNNQSMVTQFPPKTPASAPHRRLLSRTRLVTLLVLVAILVSCIAFSWTTRDAMVHLPFLGQQKNSWNHIGDQKSIVDQSPWLTVQSLTPLAVSSEERQYARDTARLADHEVDQAFAAALREATMQRKTHRRSAGPFAEGRAVSGDRERRSGASAKPDRTRDQLRHGEGESRPG